MLIHDAIIYRTSVFLSESELGSLVCPGKDHVDIILDKIMGSGWLSALRSDRSSEDKDGNKGIEIIFEVRTVEKHDRFLEWLRADPFKA